MKISTFIYNIGQGIKNIKRNKLFSLASVGTITACIFLMGMFYAIIANFQHMVKEAEESVCITVFFKEDITEDGITNIGNLIKSKPEVSKIEYTSADEAWQEFSKLYFADDPELAEGFKDDNPLAKSANYEVYLNDLSKQSEVVKYIKSIDGVRKVNDSPVTAKSLTDFGKMVGYISIAIIIILLGVAIFLISNTVMIGITVRREEIRIMKLIGASDFFVRAPFIVEGVIIGLIGAIIPVCVLMIIYEKVIVYLMTQFQTFTSQILFIPLKEIFMIIAPAALIIGAGIGFIGSKITIRKHLKV
ncbi:cell division transport system permease protein [Lachnospiraceae bacterium RM5]|nr:cell division transport system permease protein [Lachnospiraceae bacterium RM5]